MQRPAPGTLLLFALGLSAAAEAQEGRPAEPRLTLEQARERAARVDDVRYQIDLTLDGEAPEYSGRVAIELELAARLSGRDLTVDFTGGRVASVAVNGVAIETDYNGFFVTLPGDALTPGANRVDIAFSHPYSNDGVGLYRFEDPEDGRHYLYTDFEPYDQNRLFPSFDQPQLKARFTTRVTVPADWQVISIVRESAVGEPGLIEPAVGEPGPAADGDDARATRVWSFPESPPISTYIYALHAGDYRVWEATAGDIPLRLFARESQAPYVHPEDWFTPTRQGFEFFQAYFEMPYPFGKYDQVIVPHFNSGAMENVAAVTFTERYLTRGTVTRQDRRSITSVILHEMAHMWFGDIVTMDWWNGLWLNESFATFMAALAMTEATEFTDERLSAYQDTVRAYEADRRETTHPIEMPTPDTDAAFANFDTITYNKGSAVLTQLNHLVGPEVFRRGVASYLEQHAYGNTTIDDFLAAISAAADLDLEPWARNWLGEPGTNGVDVRYECADGEIVSLAIAQQAPEEWPVLRRHRTQLGLYRFVGGEALVDTLPATYTGPLTAIDEAAGLPCPDVVYANHGDWDYARVRLDAAEVESLKVNLNRFEDPLTRAMLWRSVYDRVLDAELTPTEFIDFALANIAEEPIDEVTRRVLITISSAFAYLIRIEDEASVLAEAERLEAFFWQETERSEAGSDRQLMFLDRYIRTVRTEAGRDRLAAWLADEQDGLPGGLTLDQDRRWSVVTRLARVGDPRVDSLLDAERARDPSDEGRLSAMTAMAAQPDAAQQRALASRLLAPDPELSLADARAISAGLFPLGQEALQRPIAAETLARLPEVNANVDPLYHEEITDGLLGVICEEGFLDEVNDAIREGESLHPSLRKSLLDLRFGVRRCLAIAGAIAARP